jgi:hypothetical protein
MSDTKRPWTITMDKTRMTEPPPLGPGFSIDEAEIADSMSITFSAFNDPGDDYTIFNLHAKDGSVVATRKINGY